jgi:hypothetical protein
MPWQLFGLWRSTQTRRPGYRTGSRLLGGSGYRVQE